MAPQHWLRRLFPASGEEHPAGAAVDTEMKFKSFSVIPGFGWTLGLGAGYFSVLVLLPFAALIAYGCGIRPSAFAKALGDGEILSALGLSLRASLVAGLINLVFGFILAWSIERYSFPGKGFSTRSSTYHSPFRRLSPASRSPSS